MNGKGEWGTNLVPRPRFEKDEKAGNTPFGNRLNRQNNMTEKGGNIEGLDGNRKKRRLTENLADSEATDRLATPSGSDSDPGNRLRQQVSTHWQHRHEKVSSEGTVSSLLEDTVCANKKDPIKNSVRKRNGYSSKTCTQNTKITAFFHNDKSTK